MEENHFIERTACPSCNSKDINEIYSSPYEDDIMTSYLNNFYNPQGRIEHDFLKGIDYTLVECVNCQLIYQQFIPDGFLMNKLYEEWIDPSFAHGNSLKRNLRYHTKNSYEIIDVIQESKKLPNELSFLDFGMGWSEWCIMANAFGVVVYGTELSKERIDHALKNGINIVDWDDLPNHQFDFINTEQVFEHIPEPLETMKHLIKSLKKGCLIKISVPNCMNIKRNLKSPNWSESANSERSLNAAAPLEHINCFNATSIIKMGEKCGLTHVKGVRKSRLENSSLLGSLKEIARPFYSKLKKEEFTDTSIYFRKK